MLTGPPRTALLDNTVDSALPQNDLFFQALRHGSWLAWNPFVASGVPLAASPNAGLLSPLMLPYLALPGWLAPAFVKLLEIICAGAGCYLYLRRIRLGQAAALVGGLAFVTSGYMIIWTNWPQTRVAAFIPALFWAVERLVQRRRTIDVALVAVVVTAMLFGGFPAVTGYALYTAVGYLVIRAVAEYRRQLRRLLAVLAAGAAAVGLGLGLAAVQLVPFAAFMGHAYIADRSQQPSSHLQPAVLLTAVAPWALGTTNPDRAPAYFARDNLMESLSYLGVGVLVLVLYAVMRQRAARSTVATGAFAFLLLAAVGWLALIYLGGAPLALLQHLPVFNFNFVSRARCMPAFLLAMLAAIGYELLVSWSRAQRRAPRWRQAVAPLPWAVAAAGLLAAWFGSRQLARNAPADDGVRRKQFRRAHGPPTGHHCRAAGQPRPAGADRRRAGRPRHRTGAHSPVARRRACGSPRPCCCRHSSWRRPSR